MQVKWIKVNDPMLIPISDFVFIDNANGKARPVTMERMNKAEESYQLIGGAPRIIHLAHTDIYNNAMVGTAGLKYAILDGATAFQNSLNRGRDPRDDNFEFWIAPDHLTNPQDLALIRVKLNRAQSAEGLIDVIADFARINTEYDHMLQLLLTYSEVSPTEVAVCLNPFGGLTARLQGIENGTFTASNPVRGALAVEFMNYVHKDLKDQNRVDFTKKNLSFVQEVALRFMHGTFMIDYSGYPGVLPGSQTGNLILGSGTAPTLTSRNTIKFNKIRTAVLAHDKNFPEKPFTGRKSVKDTWNNQILDDMALPRHP